MMFDISLKSRHKLRLQLYFEDTGKHIKLIGLERGRDIEPSLIEEKEEYYIKGEANL